MARRGFPASHDQCREVCEYRMACGTERRLPPGRSESNSAKVSWRTTTVLLEEISGHYNKAASICLGPNLLGL